MGERLTKEREAEIRGEDYGPRDCGCPPDYVHDGLAPAAVDDLLAELDALRAEIDAMRAAPPTTYLRADGTEEPIGELVARLTRERDGWRLRADDLTSQRDGQERDAIAARAEAGAERKARMALEARVRELLDAHAKLLDRLETAKARVRELEVERDALVTAEAYGQATAALAETRAQLERMARRERLLVEEVNGLREEANGLEAQLATLREAAEAVDEADASGDDTVLGVAIRRLRDALSTPSPTLAEIRRAAQVEGLRELAKEMAPPAAPTMGSATWDAWRERIARRFGTFDAVAIHDWLRQRADDLEAGR